jgi:CubicO group peptidase (beta-lactamase class C family)
MVVASVSKLLTAALVARLHTVGLLDVDLPTPWGLAGLAPHPGWADVTPRELLNHTSGMPVVRSQWFVPDGDCRSFLPSVLSAPPAGHRGRWTYSNGNYCALGLVAEALTSMPLDRAAQALLFDPIGASGVSLTTDGQAGDEIAYALGVERLARLGGAGSFLVSTDDVAAMLDSIGPTDRAVMTWPGLLADQYGWGHTGTVDGAKACAWVLEGGRTVVTVTVAGGTPSTGGGVCDRIVPALAADLGFGAGVPDRSPT